MDAQLSFASLDFASKKKRTKRDVFLAEMAAVVPWPMLEAIIEPYYPKVGPQGGRRPFPIAVMGSAGARCSTPGRTRCSRESLRPTGPESWRATLAWPSGGDQRTRERGNFRSNAPDWHVSNPR
jgi:hypothetical protein